jgi:hypothetical protein
MIEQGLKVAVRRKPGTLMAEVFFYSRHGQSLVFYEFATKNGQTTITEHKTDDGGAGMPGLVLSEFMLRDIIQGFLDGSKEFGITAPTESFSQGKLEAQSQHLTDLRKLLKLD